MPTQDLRSQAPGHPLSLALGHSDCLSQAAGVEGTTAPAHFPLALGRGVHTDEGLLKTAPASPSPSPVSPPIGFELPLMAVGSGMVLSKMLTP